MTNYCEAGQLLPPIMQRRKVLNHEMIFIHKVKISLKELRETEVWLKIIMEAKLVKSPGSLNSLLDETGELIAIFVRSIRTAKENNLKK